MATVNPEPELDYCSECGNYVEYLDDFTGWCESCSVKLGYKLEQKQCPQCQKPTSDGKQCSRCKYESWLERNADAIERIMAIELVTVRIAKRIVSDQNRPLCLSCKEPIKGGTKQRHFFCTKHPECIKASHVYEYHLRTKPQSEALVQAITASVIFKLTANIS